jgi:hypothetical protein
VESVLPIECEIPSLKLAVELLPNTTDLEECLIHLEQQLDEQHRDATVAIEEINDMLRSSTISLSIPDSTLRVTWFFFMTKLKNRWGRKIQSHVAHPYIVRHVLEKGAYELEYYEGNVLDEPRNGLYLKRYYA